MSHPSTPPAAAVSRSERESRRRIFAKASHSHYVEPAWCDAQLFGCVMPPALRQFRELLPRAFMKHLKGG